MINFALNIGMLFPELDFLHRFEACRAAGFKYVEFPFPYAFAPRLLQDHIEKAGLELILFDLPVDDWAEGGRGCATDPKAVAEFKRGVERALEYAKVLRPKYLTCIVGNKLPGVESADQWKVLADNMAYACDKFSPLGIEVLVELFNRQDNPDFFISHVSEGLDLLRKASRPNLKIQIDTYHVQIVEGELGPIVERYLELIGHIQVGDVPGRHQPGTGDIDFNSFFQLLERLGYDRYVALEYIPQGNTLEALQWVESYKKQAIGTAH